MKTTHKDIDSIRAGRKWHFLDASSDSLGRVATKAASLLIGKHQPFFSKHLDCGDFVVITNAANLKLTGNKAKQKGYFKHSGFPAGGKVVPVQKWLNERPGRVMEMAVKRMLPKTKLGDKMFTRLKVYKGTQHPHTNTLAPKEKMPAEAKAPEA